MSPRNDQRYDSLPLTAVPGRLSVKGRDNSMSFGKQASMSDKRKTIGGVSIPPLSKNSEDQKVDYEHVKSCKYCNA